MNFDSTKNYSPANVGDNPVVNLACGRLRFGFDDGAIGGNSYAIGVSHVYNSLRYHDDQTVGNGWQLSVMQRVFRHGQNYLVVDASGETHCFKPYYDNKYYDETNARSVLTADGNGFVLSDEVGNKVAFNADGLPVSVTSAVNSKIEKVFAYQNGRLVSIYDRRKVPSGQTRAKDRVELSYQDDKLAEMRFIVKNKPVSAARYTYQGDNLVSVSKVAFTDNGVELLEKQFMKFGYDSQNRLVAVTDAETLDAMRFTYNSGGALFKTESGFVTQDGLSAGQGISLGQIQATEPNEQFVSITSKIYGYHTINSGNNDVGEFVNKVTVTDEKGICLAYFIDSNFNIVSQFEETATGLRTLNKVSGKKLAMAAAYTLSNERINGECVKHMSESIKHVSSGEEPIQLWRYKREKYFLQFGYTFWIKHNENCERMIVQTHQDGYLRHFYDVVYIDGRATGCWQQVTVPITRQFHANQYIDITELSIVVKDCKTQKIITDCCIFGERIVPYARSQSHCLDATDVEKNNNGVVCNSVYFDGELAGETIIKTGEDKTENYFTDQDVLATMSNKYISQYLHGSEKFEPICNNGTKRLPPVQSMTVGSATREVVAFKSVSVIPTDVNQMQHNGVDMGHYLYGQQATETIYTFESSGMRVDVKQLNGKAAETSCKYSIANYLGKSLVEVDEYGLKTEYTYDQYGNPLTQSSYNANGVLNRKVVLNYDADSEYSVQEKKYGSATQGHYRQTDIKTDKFGNVSSSNTRILSLDDNEEYVNSTTDNAVGVFNDKQLSSTFGGNETYVQNSVTYQNGAIRTISDGTVKYGRIRTRKPNEDSVAYTQFTQSGAEEILRKDTVKRTGTNNQNTLNTTDFYNNEGKICYTKTSVADKYGKVGKITVNNKDRVVYTYRNANESELSAQVETVQDTATGVTRKYLFDDDGNRIGWKDYPTSAGQKKSQLIVRSVGEGVVKYSFAVDEANNKSEDYLTVATYDNNKMNPRITETSVMEDEGTKFETDAFKDIVDYHRKYVYNDDGELQRKYEPFNEDIIAEETTYGYTDVDGEKYVNNLTHKMRCISVGEQNEYTNRCTYTGTNVTQYESDLIYSPDSQRYDALKHVFERKYYRYDQFNRLVEEGVGNPEKHLGVKEYSYLSNGRHKVFAGKNCEYDNMGRMSSCGTTSYDYDFYGNRTKEVDGSTTIEYSYLDKEQLYSVSKNGKAVASYRYDAEGNRDCKSLADGTKITYYLDGNKLLGEDRTKDNKTHKLRYFYDAFGIIGFKYDDDYYCYIKDIFGSVVALSKQVKSTNDIYEQVVASYKYTTYGECTVLDSNGDKVDPSFSTFIGNVNPIRWNSHYFDAESGLYYMNCSYFDPKNGQYVDSRQISSLFDEILHSKGLDRLGIPCNNIFAIAIYLCTIQGVIKLSADPTYDMEANLPWWAKVRQAIAEFFADLNDHTTKVFMLILSCMLAFMAIYLAAQVAVAEAVTVVVKLVVGTLTGIASALAMQAISGEEITWESVRDAAIDSFFWTSVFVFASVLSSSLKGVLRSSSTANGECRTGNCFIAGTLVHTRQGVKPIEDISVGDQVLAYDEETGEQSYKKVVRLFRNTTDEWYHVAFGKEELVCTAAHPFYVVDKGFVPACELMLGDELVLANGSKTEVRSIAVECLPESEVTYNFEVEDFHTYYVSDSAVLVHNTCLDPEANADYYVQYRTQGKTVNAYHQESGIYKNKFIAPDVTKHGGSQFKLLRKAKGSKLRLIGDIDDTGKFIFAKNSSNVGNLYSYFGGGRLK